MDLATIVGIIMAIGLVLGGILLSSPLGPFIDIPSMMIVAGGATAALFTAMPLGQVLKVISVIKKAFFMKPFNPVESVTTLVKLAEVARRDGILSLESKLAEGTYDPFLVQGLRMAIDGQDPAIIEAALEQEVATIMERHSAGKAIFDNLGKYAPAYGMIGTLIGLVIMLKNMSDASSLGPAMAVALITTFYGSMISNMFCMPLADKLKARSEEEVGAKILIIRGVMSIQAGDNPRVVQQKMLAFLNPRQRASIETENNG